jgi:ParB family chromosome partitioning protein
VASVIGGIPLEEQPILLMIILERGVTDMNEAGVLRRQLLNDTIYTIGYQERDITNFINLLKKNDIERIIDVRYSSDSLDEPDFSGNVLKRELERNNIRYEHRPEYGIPNIIQDPYKEGALSYQCLKQWYAWQIKAETKLDDFIEHLKKTGKVALMSTEKDAKPTKDQKYACHRDILADIILDKKTSDPLTMFEKRKDM